MRVYKKFFGRSWLRTTHLLLAAAVICVVVAALTPMTSAACAHAKRTRRHADRSSSAERMDTNSNDRIEDVDSEELVDAQTEQQARLEYIKQQILYKLGMNGKFSSDKPVSAVLIKFSFDDF